MFYRLFIVIVSYVLLMMGGIAEASLSTSLASRLDSYVQKIDQLDAHQQDKVIEAITQYIQRPSTNAIVSEALRYILDHISVREPNGNTTKVDTSLLKMFGLPSTYQLSFVTSNPHKPRSNNMNNIIITTRGSAGAGGKGRREAQSHAWKDITSLPFTLQGELRNDIEIVEIIWDGDKAPYVLQQFSPGDTTFSYHIDDKRGNINPGMNNYLIRAYSKERVYQALFTLNYLAPRNDIDDDHIITYTNPYIGSDEKHQASGLCYDHEKYNTDERQVCLSKVRRTFTKTKTEACALPDGKYGYNLDVKRPGRSAKSDYFHKRGNILTYPVFSNDEGKYIACDAGGDYSRSIFHYDCEKHKAIELLERDHNDHVLGNCGIQISAESQKYIVFKKGMYEGPYCGTAQNSYLLNKKTGKVTHIELLGKEVDNNPHNSGGFMYSDEVYQKLLDTYKTYLGDNAQEYDDGCFVFSTDIMDIDDNGVATIRFILQQIDDKQLVYDTKAHILTQEFILDNK